jgi:hypothetical protein
MRYAVVVMSLHDHMASIEILHAESPEKALIAGLKASSDGEEFSDWADAMEEKTAEEIKDECFDGDLIVEVKEITE